MRRRGAVRMAVLGTAVTIAALLVAGCTSSSGGSNTVSNGGDANAASAPAGVAAGGLAASGARGSTTAGATAGSAPGAAPDAADVRDLTTTAEIRTAEITVAVRGSAHVAQRADAADAIAARMGGEVFADDRIGGRHASATVVLRVPPATLQSTLQALSHLGIEKGRRLSTRDVTQQVADVSSRVASATAAIAQLRVLYRRAARVRDVIRIESELAAREADLESLQARQRALAEKTALATVTLRLVTARVPAHRRATPTKPEHGFVGGLTRGWHGFTAAVGWLAVALGTLLPFLLTFLVLGLAGWWAWRRVRSSTAPPATTE